MEPRQNIPAVLADIPDAEDKLDFAPYANTVRDIILDPDVKTPLTIGLFGSWGSGKTSLMRMIEGGIKEQELTSTGRRNIIVNFNAWLYSREESLWRALITQVMSEVRKAFRDDEQVSQELKALDEQLYQTIGPAELGTLSFPVARLAGQESTDNAQLSLVLHGLDLMDAVGLARESGEAEAAKALRAEIQRAVTRLEQERVESLEQFKNKFSALVEKHVTPYGFLVAFVDDLDRCLPEKAVEVLEAIKLFLDVPGCIFVLGIDQAVIERGIRLRYGELARQEGESIAGDLIDGRKYLEKIIQIPFSLPPISPEAMGRFIAKVAPGLPHQECGTVFAQALEPNPRQVKRAINIYSLLWSLSRNKPELTGLVSPVRLAKVVVIQQRFPDLYDLLPSDPGLLSTLENHFRVGGELPVGPDAPEWANTLAAMPVAERAALAGMMTMHPPEDDPRDEMNFADLSADDARAYVFLTRAVEKSPTPTPEPSAEEQGPEPSAKPVEVLAEGGVLVESGIASSRRGYAEELAFGQLERYAGIATPYEKPGEPDLELIVELAQAGGRFFQQIFSDLSRRKQIQAALEMPGIVRVAPAMPEAQIPWEIVFDTPVPDAERLGEDPEVVKSTVELFWGNKHVVERLFTWMKVPAVEIPGPPLVNLILDDDSPSVQTIASLEPPEQGQFRRLTSINELQDSLRFGEGSVYVVHGRAGTEAGESWISIGASGDSRAALVQLRQILVERFDSEELRTLTFDLEIEYDALPADTKSGKARELLVYLERRGQLDRLLEWIPSYRPDIKLPRADVRLTRKELYGWGIRRPGSALLYLDVDAGLGRASDWGAWLELFFDMGFGGVIAPMIAPNLAWSADFTVRFLDRYLEGEVGVGQALRQARHGFFEGTGNPLGLFYAHFGPSELSLSAAPEAD